MNYFDTLENKRKHVKKYNMLRDPPPKECVERALYKAWKTTPGKNNAMAYQVLVWGPDKKEEKIKIHSLCVKAHTKAEERGVADKKIPEVKITQGGVPNPYYEHIKLNPYLFTIHSRLATPNRFYKGQEKTGHFYDQGYEHMIEHIIDSVSVEVGMFVSNLGYYLLEEGLDIAHNSCFRRRHEEWHKVGLNMVKRRPITMLTCGYAQRYRIQDLEDWGKGTWDKKPEMDEIVKWM